MIKQKNTTHTDNTYSIAQLENDELVGLEIIEITEIPSISVLLDAEPGVTDFVAKYKNDFTDLLDGIYQNFKSKQFCSEGQNCDVCLEMLWITQKAINQPYRADIKLFLLLRVIDGNKNRLISNLVELKTICCSFLKQQKYDFQSCILKDLSKLIKKINCEEVRAIIKEERIEYLQNQHLDSCFAYERFPEGNQDLSKLVNTLIENPNCAISFSLIPTTFSFQESSIIGMMTNTLSTIKQGIRDQAFGNISNVIDEKHAETYKYYELNKNSALFSFNILVLGNKEGVSNLSSKVFSHINNVSKASAVKFIQLHKDDLDIVNNFYPYPWAVNGFILNMGRNPEIWSDGISPYYRLPYVISSEEASEFFRLPIGSRKLSAGLTVSNSTKTSRSFAHSIINSGDIPVGTLKSTMQNSTISFSLEDLAKHMLVVGSTGYGKTTFLISLLDRLWRNFKIPFLVIEPVKKEYRALIEKIPDIQIFTPGKNLLSPFVFNPFVPPKNVALENYKSSLKTAFTAAVSMSSPLDKIFEETVNNCYSDFHWIDSYTTGDGGGRFNISDFNKCFRETFDKIGYTGDARNIGRAGTVRLNSLLNLFDNYHSIPIEDLLSKPTIIELAGVENSDQKALLISLLLINIYAYVNSNYPGTGGLKNVLLLEEAHVLLDIESYNNEGEANPSEIAKSLLKRLLAEIRSYGVGIMVSDQRPSKVSRDVVGLTNIKLAFRLVEEIEKEIIANSINMSEAQAKRLSMLRAGEAYLYFDKLEEPEEVRIEDYRDKNHIRITIPDNEIKEKSLYWSDKKFLLKPYPECQLISLCVKECDYIIRSKAREISRRIFSKYFTTESNSFEKLKKVYKNIERLTIVELSSEKPTKKLLSCVKLQFLRRIKYETRIRLPDKVLKETLSKIGK